MKFLLLNVLIFLGFSNVYANAASDFKSIVPKVEAVEGGSADCGGTNECGGCCNFPTKSKA